MTQSLSFSPTFPVIVQKRAALYIRVSSKKQEEEGYSIDGQKKQLLAYALTHSYHVDETHIFIEVHTGVEYRERSVLTAMRQAAYKHEFDVLLVYSLDRLARNRTHQAIIIEDLQYHGVTVHSLNKDEHADDDTIAGEIIRTVYGFVAEEEHRKILKRTQDGIRTKLEKGLLGAGRALYGYAWNANGKARTHYVLNTTIIKVDADGTEWTEGKVVQYIFAMAKAGISLRSIAFTLTRERIPTPSEKHTVWNVSTLKRMLSNSFYKGEAIVFKRRNARMPGHPYRQVLRPDNEHISVPGWVVPPLIDADTFETVQLTLQRNKEQASRNNNNPHDTLLRCGLVLCGYCGRKMLVNRQRDVVIYRCYGKEETSRYACGQASILARTVDVAAWEHAVAIIKDPYLVAQAVEQKRQKNSVEQEFAPINRRLKEIEQEVQNLIYMGKAAATGDVLELVGKLLLDLEQEKESLEKECGKLLNIDQEWKRTEENLTVFETRCAGYREKLADPHAAFSYDEKREVLEFFGIKAHVWRPQHTPRFEITCDPPSIVFLSPQRTTATTRI